MPSSTYTSRWISRGNKQYTGNIFVNVAKLWKATISFIMSVRLSIRLSVRPSVSVEHLGPHWMDLHEIKREYFSKNCRENSSSIKIRRRGITQKKACNIQKTAKDWNQEEWVLYMKTTRYLYLIQFFLEWEIFPTKVVEEIKTHFVSIIFFLNCAAFEINVEIYCRAGQATDDSMVHAQCMLDN